MPPIFIANLETEHFTFLAAGESEAEALSAMVQTMRRHRAQNGEDTWAPEWYAPYVDGNSAPHPDVDDEAWLRYLATEWYSCRVSGPYSPGAPGTRDGDPIHIRKD